MTRLKKPKTKAKRQTKIENRTSFTSHGHNIEIPLEKAKEIITSVGGLPNTVHFQKCPTCGWSILVKLKENPYEEKSKTMWWCLGCKAKWLDGTVTGVIKGIGIPK